MDMSITRRISDRDVIHLDHATISVTGGPDSGLSTGFEEGVLLIGTSDDCNVTLSDPTVSRRHAEISRTGEGFLLQDLDSTNGTFVDGTRVGKAYLIDKARIDLGKTSLTFSLSEETLIPTPSPKKQFGEMVGKSREIRESFSLLKRLSTTDVTVLLEGETGTGKELAARAIHNSSLRSSKPFVVFDCSTVPSELMESELFGHEKGAYTGAGEARQGAVNSAENGTLFIDEIGELPLALQPKLLRLLDRREYRKIGEASLRRANIRFVAATNRDLEGLVSKGLFRQDLFYRVCAAIVRLPSLKERTSDITYLADHFLEEIGKSSGKKIKISKKARETIEKHPWPGNVRELKNVLATAAALSTGTVIDNKDLSLAPTPEGGEDPGSIKEAEAESIRKALAQTDGNKRKAARLLGIAPSTLYSKMKKYGINN